MTIKVGDTLPAGTLSEFIEVEGNGCTIGPNEFKVGDLTRGRKVVIFGLPGAFTPTCSAKHVPSYTQNLDKLKAKGVAEVFCMAVNDAFVMGAWARDQKSGGKVRMMGDGSALVYAALPSPIMRTLPPDFWSRAHAPMTNASFTAMQKTSATPLAFSLSRFCV